MTTKPIKDIDDNGARLLCRNLNTIAAQFQFRRNFGGSVTHRCARQIIIDAVTLLWAPSTIKTRTDYCPAA
jgi:ribosomal protein L34E